MSPPVPRAAMNTATAGISQTIEMREETFDAAAVVRDAVAMVNAEFEAKRLEVEVATAADVAVRGDRQLVI